MDHSQPCIVYRLLAVREEGIPQLHYTSKCATSQPLNRQLFQSHHPSWSKLAQATLFPDHTISQLAYLSPVNVTMSSKIRLQQWGHIPWAMVQSQCRHVKKKSEVFNHVAICAPITIPKCVRGVGHPNYGTLILTARVLHSGGRVLMTWVGSSYKTNIFKVRRKILNRSLF